MEKTSVDLQNLNKQGNNNDEKLIISTLPAVKNWNGGQICQYDGFWYPSWCIRGVLSFQKHFQARDDDIILSSYPKSGTTWLKALAFAIVNRSRHPLESMPLLTANPHEVVLFLDLDIYNHQESPTLEDLPRPRVFAIHTPLHSLPHSITNSNCRIVYLCRNPLDQFISHWLFLLQIKEPDWEPLSFEEAFDMFCDGAQEFGPFSKHVLEYWNASREKPHNILFLKYEDLQENIGSGVKRLAEFFGCPFSKDEEGQGMVEEISKFCSFDNLKNLEVNKNGQLHVGFKNKHFFRKGKVGDWKNYLTASMRERLEKMVKEDFEDSGLTFKTI